MSLHKRHHVAADLAAYDDEHRSALQLEDGSHVAVIGGGPAGSFVSYFLLDMAERFALDVEVDIYEPRDFSRCGPSGCNHCGGIVAESLVQIMAADGIGIPSNVVQRGIDSYVLHTDEGSVHIETPLHEKRIAAVFRGGGPRGIGEAKRDRSFDRFLLNLAVEKGACHVPERVNRIEWKDRLPHVGTPNTSPQPYDLVVGAVGVNSAAVKLFEGLGFGYKQPQATKTFICELPLGTEAIQKHLGSSMHVFLLNLPRLEFAALIPKGEFVTVVMLGEDIDGGLVQTFLSTTAVKRCLPAGWEVPHDLCHCSARINVKQAMHPFSDRIVLVGDCGVARLYKDGIGSAYRTAKAVAATAIMHGVSARDFEAHYMPTYRLIANDNQVGKVVFFITRHVQKYRFARRALLNTVLAEQKHTGAPRRMSTVLWDTFTGSAPYREVFLRTLHPVFLGRFVWKLAGAILHASSSAAGGDRNAAWNRERLGRTTETAKR